MSALDTVKNSLSSSLSQFDPTAWTTLGGAVAGAVVGDKYWRDHAVLSTLGGAALGSQLPALVSGNKKAALAFLLADVGAVVGVLFSHKLPTSFLADHETTRNLLGGAVGYVVGNLVGGVL